MYLNMFTYTYMHTHMLQDTSGMEHRSNQICRMSSYCGIAQLKALCVFSTMIDTLRELVQEILSELRFLSLDFESRKAASLLCSVNIRVTKYL